MEAHDHIVVETGQPGCVQFDLDQGQLDCRREKQWVEGNKHEGSFYAKSPFTEESDWAVTSISLDLVESPKNAESPC